MRLSSSSSFRGDTLATGVDSNESPAPQMQTCIRSYRLPRPMHSMSRLILCSRHAVRSLNNLPKFTNSGPSSSLVNRQTGMRTACRKLEGRFFQFCLAEPLQNEKSDELKSAVYLQEASQTVHPHQPHTCQYSNQSDISTFAGAFVVIKQLVIAI